MENGGNRVKQKTLQKHGTLLLCDYWLVYAFATIRVTMDFAQPPVRKERNNT